MYQARTIWQGEPEWELVITLGQFQDIKSAAHFANRGIHKLYYDEERRSLFVISKKGESIQVQQEKLVVSKIKPEAVGKLMVDADDFEPVDVKIEDFPEIEGLDSGFGSLAYSVVDEAGNFVDFRFVNCRHFFGILAVINKISSLIYYLEFRLKVLNIWST